MFGRSVSRESSTTSAAAEAPAGDASSELWKSVARSPVHRGSPAPLPAAKAPAEKLAWEAAPFARSCGVREVVP